MADPEVFDIPEEHLGLEEETEPQFDPYKVRIDHASLKRAIANQSIDEVRGDNLGKFPVTRTGVRRPEVFQIPEVEEISDDARLGAVFEAVQAAGTDNHAKILAVAEETGLPPSVIKHQLPAWEAKMQTARFDPVKFRADYPALSGLILKNPQMAPALIKEQGVMAKLEDFLRKSPTLLTSVPGMIAAGAVKAFSKGNPLKGAGDVVEDVELGLQHSKLQTRLGTIAKKQFAQAGGKGEGPTAAELQEADEIELEMAFINAIRPDTGFLAGLPGAASEQVYRYINNAKDIGDYMAVGAAAGATAGGIAGSAAFGVGAVPGAAAGFLGGAGWGMTAGVFATTAEEEGALFFRQLIKDGVDPKAAYAASMFLGVANGALEAAPVDKVLRMTPGAKTILTGPTKDILRKLVAKPTVSNALVRAGGRMAEGMIFEGVTEGLQEVTSTATEAYVKTGDPSAALASIWHERDKIYTATKKGAQAAGGMTLASPFAALETVTDIKEARQAVRDQQFWEALSKGLTESDLAKNYPPAIAAMVKNARRMYGAFKEVSVPVQALSEFFTAEGTTLEQVAEKLPDVARQMSNADPSAEVTIKTEDFITHFVPSAGFKALQPDIRVGNRPTAREAPDVEKGAEEILKEVAKHEEEKTAGGETPLRRGLEVYEAVRNTLVGLDVTPEVASTDAALWQSFVNARASRLGKDPTEYFKGLNIQFVREPGTIKMSLKDKGDIASLYQKDDPRLTPHQRELHALIETANTPAERAAALDELVESLMRDELTGADTQNAWQRFAPKDAFGNYINPKPGWYLAIDVNDLKRVNDVIGGHGGGDALLSALGRAIGPGVRSRRGKFFRSGGDEFMGHFQTRAQAESAMKEINKAVNALPFMFNGAFKASISVGLAMDPARADQAMFKAKEQARANGRSGFGREGAADVVNLDAGDVFAEIDASLNEEETETLFQKDGANGEVISAVPEEQLSDASTYAAFRLPDGRVAITGAVHDIANLPEAVKTEFFSDPDWYDKASRALKEGALVHGRATKSGKFWATEDIENLFQGAYHGSPHVFDKFTLEKIGTGEGAQAYGWGLYFASSKSVAKYYKEKLANSQPEVTYNGVGVDQLYRDEEVTLAELVSRIQTEDVLEGRKTPTDEIQTVSEELTRAIEADSALITQIENDLETMPKYNDARLRKSRESYVERVKDRVVKMRAAVEGLAGLDASKISVNPGNKGRLYEVEIPENEELLDYDKPMTEQPRPVLERLEKAGLVPEGFAEFAARPWDPKEATPKGFGALHAQTGRDFYEFLGRKTEPEGLEAWAMNRPDRAASLALRAAGIQGLRYLDGSSRAQGEGSHNFVIWDDEAIKILQTLEQMGDSGARGKFEYTKARDWMKITLSGRANLSTFLHESGHAFMAILERDAMTDERSASELQTIKNWLGVTGKKQITRAQYEQFAQGFEAYLREGKAPSTALAQAFESFKAWLRNIYASIVQLGNVQLDDEIRGVMDRLLATDMEIKEAQEKLGVVPLEDNAKLMPEEEYAEYRLRFTEAVEAAQAAADRASIREFHRTVSDERRMLERQVEKAGREHPVHNARELILNGKRLTGAISEGALMMAGRKLDSATLADLPLDRAQRARLRQLTEKGGMDPEFAAAALGGKDAGFATGKDLLMALADMPSLERWVKQETDKRMSEKYPGYKNNHQWNQENVHRALHVDQIGNAIWAGMVAMTKKLGGKQGKSAKQAIKAGAERRVGEKTILEMKPHLSMRNEAKAAREAAEAWKAGDVRLAYEATRRQLFYHFEWRAMDKARTEVKKITDYFGSFKDIKKRTKLGKGNFELLEAIDAVLSQVEYGETLERGADLSEVVKKLREQGYPVALPADFNYKILEGDYEAMTLDGIHAVRDVIQNFEHIALSEYKEKAEAEKQHFQSLTQQIASHIRVNLGKELPAERPNEKGLVQLVPTRWDAFKAKVRSIPWALKKFEYLARIADGGQTAGFFHLHAFQPVADAEAYEHTLMRDVFTKLRTEFERLPFMERMKHDKQVEFLGGLIPHRDVLMIAGHMRNQGNIDRLVRNHGWDPKKIVARLDEVMTDEDIETINNIGRLMESLWPKVVEVYKRVYGVEPKKVEGNDIILPKTGRVIEGGYFPILRDPKDPYHADAAAGELWDKDFVSMMVGHGFTEERSKTADTRLSLSLDALPSHLVKVIHFISHFEATHKVDRLLKDPGVRSAIEDGLSPEAYAEMGPWLKNIVHGGDVGTEVVGGLDAFLRHTRVGATIVLLGARMSTAVIQGMGLTMTMKELSTTNGKSEIFSRKAVRYMRLGIWQFMRDTSEWIRNGFKGPGPFQMIEAVNDDWILHRENYERDLRLEYKRLTSAFSEFGHARKRMAEFSMAMFNLVQGTVNAISWHAALRKAQEEGHARPDDYANAVIRMGQSAGGPKDLAGIQRGSEFKKWLTVLYSFANIIFNSTTEQSPKHLSASEKISNRTAQLWWVVLAPAVIAILLKGDDDDFDDPESFVKAVGVESAMFWARGMPLVGDYVRAARGYDAKQAPWLEFMAAGAKAAGKATGFNEDDAEITDRDVRALINMLGTLGHIPTQAGMNLVDYYEQFPMMEDKLLNAAARTPRQYK